MKTSFKIMIFLLSGMFFLQASPEKKCNLKVSIKEIKHSKGNIGVSLYNKKHKDFPNDRYVFMSGRIELSKGQKEFVFKSIPCGMYAVSVIHDENSNERFDVNFIGIPKEGYGFSNNPNVRFGPSEYEKSEFSIVNDMNIFINMVYL